MADNLRICLIGSTGNGKSTLGNVLLGFNINGLDDADQQLVGFRVESDADICTTVTELKSNHWLGDPKIEVVEIIDTPGHGGGGDKAEDYRQEMVNFIRNQKSIDAIICVRNSQQPRFDSHDVEAFRVFTEMFGLEKFFQNLVIVLSRWSSSPGEISQKKKSGATLEKLIGNLRAQMESRYPGVSRNIPILTLDALYWPDDDHETRTFMEGAGTLLSILKEYHKHPLIVGAVKMVEDQDKKLERNVAALKDMGDAMQRQHEKDIHDQRRQLEDMERKNKQAALDAEERANEQKGFFDKACDLFSLFGSGSSPGPLSSTAGSKPSVGALGREPSPFHHGHHQMPMESNPSARGTPKVDAIETEDQQASNLKPAADGRIISSGRSFHSSSNQDQQVLIQQKIENLQEQNLTLERGKEENSREIVRLQITLSQLQQSNQICGRSSFHHE